MSLRTSDPEAPDTPELDDTVSVQTERPRFLQRIGFPAGLAPVRESIFVVLLVAPILTALYRLWDATWRVPWSYSGDGLQTSAYVKSILDNGWYLSPNPRLGAPFTADWRDFPLGGENIHWVALKILGVFTGNYALAMNLYFLLGFFFIALTAHFVARYLGFSTAASLVIAVSFAFLPYHGVRNVGHLVRSNYFSVPLGVLVIIWLANYGTDFLRRDDDGRHWRRGRLAVAVAIGVIVGASDTQNAMFLASLLAVVALVSAARDRDWRPIALLALLGAATFGSLVVNNTPFVLSRVERGGNAVAANRPLTDQDQYGLRPVDLVLPAAGHRIPKLRNLAAKADSGRLLNSEAPGTPLGTLGAVGLVLSIGAALSLGLGVRPRSDAAKLAAQLGTINLAAIVIGVVGGFAYLIAVEGFTAYRTWNRISVFIAFAALLATALILDWVFGLVRRVCSGRRLLATVITAVLVVVLCVCAGYDQITPRARFNYPAITARFNIDADFYSRLEASVPKGSMMFQLPFEQFPEAGNIVNMTDYQDFAGYLHTKNLRWNYGGMKGRPEGDWQTNLSIYDPVAALASIAAIGFQGVVVDRTGFTDNAANLLLAAQPLTGGPKLQSSDGRLVYLDLTGLRARLQSELGADQVQHAADITLGNAIHWTGFSFPEPLCHGKLRWATTPHGVVAFDNTTGGPLTFNPSTAFQANPNAERIDVRGPGFHDTVQLRNGTGSWQRSVTLPPGTSQLDFTLTGPKFNAPGDARTLQFALVNYSFGPHFDSPIDQWAQARSPAGCEGG